jgi:hypothetical protein
MLRSMARLNSPEIEKRIKELGQNIAELTPVVDKQIWESARWGPTTNEMDQLEEWKKELKRLVG